MAVQSVEISCLVANTKDISWDLLYVKYSLLCNETRINS